MESHGIHQEQTPATAAGRKELPVLYRLPSDCLGSGSTENALGVLVGGEWDVSQQQVLAATMANGNLGCMNRGKARDWVGWSSPSTQYLLDHVWINESTVGSPNTRLFDKLDWVQGRPLRWWRLEHRTCKEGLGRGEGYSWSSWSTDGFRGT